MPANPTPPAIGIDLGTTFSVIAFLDKVGRPTTIPNTDGDLTTPSVVFFDRDLMVVGKEAVKAAVHEPEVIAQFVKRDMGKDAYSKLIRGESYPPEVIQSLILEKLKKDAETKLGPIRDVVITVPAYFNEPKRKATQDAGELAGLQVLDIINEPTAAALAYGIQEGFLTSSGASREAETVLVYDLGGGTFDVTLMKIEGRGYRTLATSGDMALGGIDWDRRLVDYIAERFTKVHPELDPRTNPIGLQRLTKEAEEAKRTLSAREQVTVHYDHSGHQLRIPISRAQFEAMTEDLLERTRFTTAKVLSDAKVAPSDLTRILLVGGSTRMPMVKAMLERELGITPDQSLSADEAVAHGAAIYAGLLMANEPTLHGLSIKNVNSHSLGVLAIEPGTGRKRNRIMVPENTPIPVEMRGRFKTRQNGQKNVLIEVIEGGDESGFGATHIGRCVVDDLPPELPAGTSVEVSFQYQQNGRIQVEACLPTVGKQAAVSFNRATGLSEEKRLNWQKRLARGIRPLNFEV